MKQHAPSAERNRDVILEVLRRVLPAKGLVLEIASGSGQHAAWFAEALPTLTWQPSDPGAEARASIDAWRLEHAGDVRPALALDVTADPWPVTAADAIVCINMVHISPWAATEALLRGAARVLPPGGVLYLYGAYKRGGAHTAPSNEAFDQWLKGRDSAFGVRDLEAVVEAAAAQGMALREVVEMPANNLSVVFARG
jgi:SAM-dependent methyltransferase